MVAMLFIEQRDVLVTAGRDGSSLFNNIFLFLNSVFFPSVKVWDNRWFILYAYVGHHDRVLSLSKHPFGPYVISSSLDRTIRVWSLEYGDVVDV
jgi:WD40 repeat protein